MCPPAHQLDTDELTTVGTRPRISAAFKQSRPLAEGSSRRVLMGVRLKQFASKTCEAVNDHA
jgi:hypothetical protein